jgi:hypothetical protein
MSSEVQRPHRSGIRGIRNTGPEDATSRPVCLQHTILWRKACCAAFYHTAGVSCRHADPTVVSVTAAPCRPGYFEDAVLCVSRVLLTVGGVCGVVSVWTARTLGGSPRPV